VNPLTVAHVLPSFGLGGQEQVALQLAIGQRAAGHGVVAVALAPGPDGPMAARFAAAGIATHTVPKLGPTVDGSLPARLSALFRREGVSVVHAHNPQPLFYAAMAGKGAGAAVVYTCHGDNTGAPRTLWLTRMSALWADAYVAVSPRIAALARRMQECAEYKLHVIENGVDLSAFLPDPEARRQVRCEWNLPAEAFVIGTVGRLAPDKSYHRLIRAAAPLLGARCRLVLVGDGSDGPSLRALAAAQPTAAFIHFAGVRADVARLLPAFDVFALSSRTEGLPLAVLEAMACGLPVISTAVGGVPDVVNEGVSGLLVPNGDEPALEAALASLRADPARAAALGAAGRAASRQHSAAVMLERYLALYQRCRAEMSGAARPKRAITATDSPL
jgi:glycosyltransferase involved in cell wall biosynthesis